jgi:hypothetical protein
MIGSLMGSDCQQDFDGTALVHRLVALRGSRQRQGEVEDRGRPTVDVDACEEQVDARERPGVCITTPRTKCLLALCACPVWQSRRPKRPFRTLRHPRAFYDPSNLANALTGRCGQHPPALAGEGVEVLGEAGFLAYRLKPGSNRFDPAGLRKGNWVLKVAQYPWRRMIGVPSNRLENG